MSLTSVTYPITGTAGSFSNNIFPSQKRLEFTARRIDATINTISSGTDGKVRIEANVSITNVAVGDYVSFGSDFYETQSARVVAVVNATTIEVDVAFVSSNALNGFVNFHKDYFLEIRYVLPNSVSNDQNAIELIGDYTQTPSDLNGDIVSNIGIPSDLITPQITSGSVPGMSVSYKIQYRESYEGNRSGSWVSPSSDSPILLIHSSEDLSEGFTDVGITKRFTKGYPLYYSFINSDVNASDSEVSIIMRQYSIGKVQIAETTISTISDLNGLFFIKVDPSEILADTVFVEFDSSLVATESQFDPTQFDPTQFA